ncbi:MAG: hypothetical protein PHY54_07835 [Methylococcales bacterium]|nr:hypothetical protein [Methylococcales bacterium]
METKALENFFQNMDLENASTLQTLLNQHKESIDNINKAVNLLEIPIIKNCIGINPQGFIINISGVDDIKNSKQFISEGSICVFHVQKVKESDYHGDISRFIDQDKIIDIYIRLGLTNTWLHANFQTLVHLALEANFEKTDEYDEDYDFYDDSDDDAEGNTDYERLNRLATIVAKSKGFNLLKNRDQRKMFAKEALNNTEQEFGDHELYGIATTAETFYEFGVLPIEAGKLQFDGKSEQEIAKILGHTKAKIEKALQCEVPDIIRKNIDQYEESNT